MRERSPRKRDLVERCLREPLPDGANTNPPRAFGVLIEPEEGSEDRGMVEDRIHGWIGAGGLEPKRRGPRKRPRSRPRPGLDPEDRV